MDDELVERVLRAAELVPHGRVVSYGDIAALVGTGPRQVGQVMSRWGSGVPWWRVTNRDGKLPAELLPRAVEQWLAEGIEVTPSGTGCRISRCRADLPQLLSDYEGTEGLRQASS